MSLAKAQSIRAVKGLDRKYQNPEDEHYHLLTNRNFHFVSAKAQAALRNIKILVAGCGSGGGACVEPLVRLGVTHMKMAEPGSYEVTNFNRQRAYLPQVGVNKGTFLLESVKRVNPYGDFEAIEDGIQPHNVEELVSWADFVLDCVDVTTTDAISMKIKLHEVACAHGKPVISPLDLGYCQTGLSFDYRKKGMLPLGGAIPRMKSVKHPVKVLFMIFPLSRVPTHSLKLVEDALKKKPHPISQLGCASDLISSLIAAAMVRFVETGELIKDWHIDLSGVAYPRARNWMDWITAPIRRWNLKRLMRRIA